MFLGLQEHTVRNNPWVSGGTIHFDPNIIIINLHIKWKQIYTFHKKIIFEVRIFMNIIQHPNKLEEKKQHGTIYFPCATYQSNYNSARLFVAYHWHPQIEIIHLKKEFYYETKHKKIMVA